MGAVHCLRNNARPQVKRSAWPYFWPDVLCQTYGMSQHDEENPPIEERIAQVGAGPWGDAALAAGASLLGGLVPPAAPYIAGGVVLLRDLGKRVSGHVAKRDELLLDSGSRASGLDPAILIERLLGDEELTMLAAAAIDASRRSRMPEKARMLGRCLGAIASDDARIEEEELWVSIIARIERPHIKVASLFVGEGGKFGTGQPLPLILPPKSPEEIGEATGLGPLVMPLIQDLLLTGILIKPGVEGMTYQVPDAYKEGVKAGPLAGELLSRLWDAQSEEGDSQED